MKKIVIEIAVTLVLCINSVISNPYVEEVYHWKQVEYENLPKSANSYVGPYRYYIPENCDTIDFGYHPASGLMIATIVRLRPGIPSSLGAFCVQDYTLGSSPKFWGFPNYEINALHDSDFAAGNQERRLSRNHATYFKPNKYNQGSSYNQGYYSSNYYGNYQSRDDERFISVCYVTIDEVCNRVFFLDRGMVRYYMNTSYVVHNPALVVIDLPVDGCQSRNFPISRRAVVPDRLAAKGANGYMAVTLDFQSKNSCDDLFAYIPNPFYSFLLVYDFKKDEFWAFDHESFHPVLSESPLVFDKTFDYRLEMGLFSIVLGYPDRKGDRIAYYEPAASTAQFAVSTKILKDKKKAPQNYNWDDFRIMGYRGCGHQALRTSIDYKYGVVFYGEAGSNQIRCWNIRKPLNPDNVGVVYESDELLFTTHTSIDSLGYLWFHTCHLPIVFITDIPLNLQEINSRNYRIKVSDAIRGTVCEY